MAKPETGVVNIRGKEYQTVALRVQKFREAHSEWTIDTEIVTRDADCVVMRARILDETGRLRGTGYSEEYRKSSQINRTSALENAETSAIGRALAACGFGGTEYASANEVQNAIQQQEAQKPDIPAGKPTDGAWDGMDPAQQQALQQIAATVGEYMESGDASGAYEYLERQNLAPEEKIALWTLLPSKTRTALKKAHQEAA